MRGARRILATALAVIAVAGGASACGTDLAGFAHRADAACAKAARSIDRLAITGDTSTGTPTAALRTALDRYKIIELLISELVEGAKPDGPAGKQVESKWLDPARRSLTQQRATLLELSHAVRDGDEGRVAGLAGEADRAGTDGVDAQFLEDSGMPACSALFR